MFCLGGANRDNQEDSTGRDLAIGHLTGTGTGKNERGDRERRCEGAARTSSSGSICIMVGRSDTSPTSLAGGDG